MSMKNNFWKLALTITIFLVVLLNGANKAKASSITNFKMQIFPTRISTAPRATMKALSFFDIDKNGVIELGELFEAIKRWVMEFQKKGSKGGDCDLNQDGRCSLIDLSILLYFIGR